jgi:hypothetical protein
MQCAFLILNLTFEFLIVKFKYSSLPEMLEQNMVNTLLCASHGFLEQETLYSLLSAGWFQ